MSTTYVCPDCQEDVTAAVERALRTTLPVVFADRAPRGDQHDLRDAPARMPDRTVLVQCSKGHLALYPSAGEDAGTIVGLRVGADDAARWSAWRTFADPAAGMARLDAYAKWILGGNTLIGVLAAGTALMGVTSLANTKARWVYGLAFMLLGLSMTAAALSIAPRLGQVKIHDPVDVAEKYAKQLAQRHGALRWATILFGGALVAAAFVPLLANVADTAAAADPRVMVTYTLTEAGALTAKAVAVGMPPNSPVGIAVTSTDSAAALLPTARESVGATGTGEASITVADTRKLKGRLTLSASASDKTDTVTLPATATP